MSGNPIVLNHNLSNHPPACFGPINPPGDSHEAIPMRTASTGNARGRLTRVAIETLERRALLSGDGLQATYYAGPNFSGATFSRVDATINFNWKHNPPAGGFAANQMSVRWTGQLLAPGTGKYTFYATSQGGLKLWIDAQLLVNAWKNHHTQTTAR